MHDVDTSTPEFLAAQSTEDDVLIFDEFWFLLHRIDGRVRVGRKSGQRFQSDRIFGLGPMVADLSKKH